MGRKSNYQLAGPPGWTSDADPTKSSLTPHPDWYITVLWKQLMGSTALGNVTVNGTNVKKTGNAPNASVQVWCTNKAFFAAGPAANGAVTLAIANGASVAQEFTVPSIASPTPRVEYILTASKAMYMRTKVADSSGAKPLPDVLWSDDAFLNGERMTVSSEGVLPKLPIPGKTQSQGTSFLFPPFSYGFVVFPSAGVAACGGS